MPGVVLVDPQSGREVVAEGDAADRFRAQGYRPRNLAEQGQAATAETQRGLYNDAGSKLEAFGQGGLRGLSVGLSDVVQGLGGDRQKAHLKALKEEQGGLSLGGEIVGTAAGGFTTLAPAGLSARAARAAAAKVGGADVAGRTAGQKVAAAAVEGAVDGGLFNAGQTLSNTTLNNDPVTIDALASSIPTGMLFGGGIGGGLGAAGAASGAIRKKMAAKANPLLNARSQGAKDLGASLGTAIKEMDDGVESAYHQMRDRRAGEIMQERDAAVGGFAVSPDLAAEVQGAASASAPRQPRTGPQDEVFTAAGKKRPKAPRDFDTPEAKLDTGNDTRAARPPRDTIVDGAEPQMVPHPDHVGMPGKRALRDTAVDALPAGRAAGALEKDAQLAGQTLIDDVPYGAQVGALQKEAAAAEKVAAKAAAGEAKAAQRADTMLDAAPAGAQRNALHPPPRPGESAVAYAVRAADSEMAEMWGAHVANRRKMAERFGDTFNIDIAALARKPPAEALKSLQVIDDYARSGQAIKDAAGITDTLDPQKMLVSKVQQRVSPEAAKAFEGLAGMDRAAIADILKVDASKVPQFGPAADHVLKAYSVARFADGATAKAAVTVAEAKIADAVKGLGMDAAVGGAGFLLGGMQGAAAGAVLRVLGRPALALMRLATKSGEFQAKLAAGVDNFVQAATGAAQRRTYSRTGLAILDEVRFAEKEAEGSSAGVRRIRELRDTVSNPARLEAYLDDQLAPLRAHNLDTGYAVAESIKARLSFLASKTPGIAEPDPFTGWEPEPSDAEMAEWARYVEAAERGPVALVEELASGDLAPETVEAVRELYPGAFESIQRLIIERAADRRKPLDYEARHTMTLMFDVPVEPTDAPLNVAMLQEMYALQAEEQAAAKPRGTPKPPSPTKGQQLAQ